MQLNNDSFYSLLTNGHRNKEEEKKELIDTEEVIESQRGAISKAIQQAQEEAQADRITSREEKEELSTFRDQVREESMAKGNEEAYRELIREDALPHPDAKGYTDKK